MQVSTLTHLAEEVATARTPKKMQDKDTVLLMNSEANGSHGNDSCNNSNSKPMVDDFQNPQRNVYSYTCAPPWVSPPVVESDAMIFSRQKI
jgi:hypothetical protein